MTSDNVHQTEAFELLPELSNYIEPAKLFTVKGLWAISLPIIIFSLAGFIEVSKLCMFIPALYMLVLMFYETKVMKDVKEQDESSLSYNGQLVKDLVLKVFSKKKNIYFVVFCMLLLYESIFVDNYFALLLTMSVPLVAGAYKTVGVIRIYLLTH